MKEGPAMRQGQAWTWPSVWAREGRQEGTGSISPLPGGTEALQHSRISQKAITRGFETLREGWSLLPSQGCRKGRVSSQGGGKKPSSAPRVPSALGAPCPPVGPRRAPALPPMGGRLRESQTPRNSLLLDRRNTKG